MEVSTLKWILSKCFSCTISAYLDIWKQQKAESIGETWSLQVGVQHIEYMTSVTGFLKCSLNYCIINYLQAGLEKINDSFLIESKKNSRSHCMYQCFPKISKI